MEHYVIDRQVICSIEVFLVDDDESFGMRVFIILFSLLVEEFQ